MNKSLLSAIEKAAATALGNTSFSKVGDAQIVIGLAEGVASYFELNFGAIEQGEFLDFLDLAPIFEKILQTSSLVFGRWSVV